MASASVNKPKVLVLNAPDKAPSDYVAKLKEEVEFYVSATRVLFKKQSIEEQNCSR